MMPIARTVEEIIGRVTPGAQWAEIMRAARGVLPGNIEPQDQAIGDLKAGIGP
jgi:hypothetical protein